MHQVWREESACHLGLYRIELAVLTTFLDDVADRLRLEEEETDDPFALWERDMVQGSDGDPDERDPLLDRLFPPVFPDDARASAEHRRFSEDEQRRQKAREADLVLAELETAKGRLMRGTEEDPVHVVVVPDHDFEAWLRTLNAARLALALDLDITSADDMSALAEMAADDDRVYPYSVYEFLGEMQGYLLALRGWE